MTFTTRRRVLVGAAIGGSSVVAGCLDSATPSSETTGTEGDTDTDTESVPERPTEPSGPLYERWLPALARERGNPEANSFSQMDHAAFRAATDHLPDGSVDPITEDEAIDELGIDTSTLESTLSFGGSLVLSGPVDPSAVTAAVESDASSVTERGVYTVYDGVTTGPFDDMTIAVGPTAVVVQDPDIASLHGQRFEETVPIETLLEAATDDRIEWVHETDTDMAALLEAAHSEPPTTEGSSVLECGLFDEHSRAPAGAKGGVLAWTFAGERTHLRFGFVFETEADVDREATTAAIGVLIDFEVYDDIETTRIGRTAMVSGTIATDEFDVFGPPRKIPARPQAGLAIDIDSAANEAHITLMAIDRLETLRILVDGDEEWEIEEPTVGDSYTVEGASGATIRVIGEYDGTEAVIASEEI